MPIIIKYKGENMYIPIMYNIKETMYTNYIIQEIYTRKISKVVEKLYIKKYIQML